MKKVNLLRLLSLAALGLTLIVAGCLDISKFSDSPVQVAVAAVDQNGDPITDAFVMLFGPASYEASVDANGVAQFDSVEPGNYELFVYSPRGLVRSVNAPIWGGKPANFTITVSEEHNLVFNPVFAELDGNNMPVGWHTPIWAGEAEFWVEIGTGPFGENVAVVHAPDGVDGGWGQYIPVQRNRTYRLSGWVRAENFSRDTGFGAQYSIDEIGQSSVTPSVTGDEWIFVSSTINSGNRDSLRVLTLVGGWGKSSGTFYFTGVSLVPLN